MPREHITTRACDCGDRCEDNCFATDYCGCFHCFHYAGYRATVSEEYNQRIARLETTGRNLVADIAKAWNGEDSALEPSG